jgi:hypothetical protein
VVVNDQENHVLDQNDWWAGVNSDDVDTYFFGHGHEYTQALQDYTLVGGKIAMPPRYVTGIWWCVIPLHIFCSGIPRLSDSKLFLVSALFYPFYSSSPHPPKRSRWYNLNNENVMDIVEDYHALSFPLDVFVLDMDWHTKQGWGGYSWDKSLFPLPNVRIHLVQLLLFSSPPLALTCFFFFFDGTLAPLNVPWLSFPFPDL